MNPVAMRSLLFLLLPLPSLLAPVVGQESRPAGNDATQPVTRGHSPSVLDRRPTPAFPAPADAPAREDLVFCAFGSHGTGQAGQRRIAEAVARLAPTGPLDFVLLLGDNVCPRGVRSLDDPLWESRFEDVYDRRKLDVPFYAVLGEADHGGDIKMQIDYGRVGRRWTMPNYVYDFRVTSHGKTLHFFGADTTSMIGDIGNPQNRIANRLLVHAIQSSQADWKIVFAYQPMFSGGSEHESDASKKMRERLAYFL